MFFEDYRQEILEGVSDGVWLLSTKRPFLSISENFWLKLGENYPNQEVTIEDFKQHVFEEDLPVLNSLLDQGVNYTEMNSEIIRFVHKTGKWVWFEIKVKQLRNDRKNDRAFICFDISASKERERIYLEFDQMNRTGGWLVDLATSKIFWTPSMYLVHGMDPQETTPSIGDAINFYKEGESRERIKQLFGEAVEKGISFDAEFEFVDSLGRVKWVKSRGKPVMKNGACVKVYGTLQDITEEKRKAREVAEESKRQFEEIFNSTYQFCGILDSDGTILNVNNQALEFGDVQLSEVVGKKFWEALWWQNSKKNKSRLKKSVKTAVGGETVRYNTTIWDGNRQEVAIDFSLKSMSTSDNSSPLLIAEGRVIQDMIDIQRDLETLVKSVSKHNETLRNFAYIVSHNLRSHASNISLLAGILKDSVGEPLEQNVQSMLEQASERLADTIGHVNDVVIINTEGEASTERINLKKVADEAVSTVSAISDAVEADIRLNISPKIHVLGTYAYLESALLNVITNSIKYRSDNRDCLIQIAAKKKKDRVILTLEDNGLGIDMKKHEKNLFGMYKTFHGNTDARGIGLFITKNQVESMGGNISAESQVNKGTKFTIELVSA
ncbi:MAG TPA: PAS domain S-box protein [Cryomorphaceae bacterium]|nr:PAS domain S-box protein [Cryomorphaceae bacterium]